jgi:hypothetical protein
VTGREIWFSVVGDVVQFLDARRMRHFYQTRSRCAGKVTLIELLWVILWIGGSAAGFGVGWFHFGLVGAVVGLILGFGLGFLISCGIAYILNLWIRRRNKP